MTQKISALLAALVFVFSVFTAYAEETAPVPAQPPNVAESKPAPAPVPMPDLGKMGMEQATPRVFGNGCREDGGSIFFEGYNKKENKDAMHYDAVRFFLGDATATPFATTLIEVSVVEISGQKKEVPKITAYLDFFDRKGGERDGIADFVADADDPRLEGTPLCSLARKTKAEWQNE